MRAYNRLLIFTALIASVNVAFAQRDDPLQVFSQLKQLEQSQAKPQQRRSRTILIDLEDFVDSNQAEALLAGERSIQISIQNETSLLNQLTRNDVKVSGPMCVEFINENIAMHMKLAGVAYTNCLNIADERVFSELAKIPTVQSSTFTREKYNDLSLLGSFRGGNIFIDPVTIRNKLSSRLRTRSNLPIVQADTTTNLKTVFDEVISNIRTCMTHAQTQLAGNLDFTRQQVIAICAGQNSDQV
ncbi:uncharacterized protein LOC129776016 [Toxorhynchites rutilus septentrionalis]|uniref:uncharacterized protein LOC129776016 n=1 Tax=Toxorhynchites rutilus septentrionalis TaxID=329112 RepID=UPI00247B0F32|nr:uncharacterized protein LOC129776016 [Toxorhynchites rutilus septentrionalis]